MRPKFLAQSHTISRKLSSNAPASLRSLYISKNRTKRQLLPAACSKNPDCDSPRRPCTQTAICAAAAAVAVNHPHHTNCVNHSSNKCQPALANALIPVNPSSHRVCRHAPKISHTISHILSQSLVYLSSISTFPLHFKESDKETTPTGCLQQESHCDSPSCPCTQTAIRAIAAAVNHPHHTNCVNHSSNKCQPALARALTPEHNPSIPRTRRDTLPPSAKFFREQKNTRIHAAIRATSRQFDTHPTPRQDTEQGIT